MLSVLKTMHELRLSESEQEKERLTEKAVAELQEDSREKRVFAHHIRSLILKHTERHIEEFSSMPPRLSVSVEAYDDFISSEGNIIGEKFAIQVAFAIDYDYGFRGSDSENMVQEIFKKMKSYGVDIIVDNIVVNQVQLSKGDIIDNSQLIRDITWRFEGD